MAEMRQSVVCEMPINFLSWGNGHFDTRGPKNGIPIVLVPKHCPWHFLFSIPSKVHVVKNCCRVSHIVTTATITYNVPVRSASTSDNVMVDIDP